MGWPCLGWTSSMSWGLFVHQWEIDAGPYRQMDLYYYCSDVLAVLVRYGEEVAKPKSNSWSYLSITTFLPPPLTLNNDWNNKILDTSSWNIFSLHRLKPPIYLCGPGNTLGSLQISWRKSLRPWKLRCLCWDCCPLQTNFWESSRRWLDEYETFLNLRFCAPQWWKEEGFYLFRWF